MKQIYGFINRTKLSETSTKDLLRIELADMVIKHFVATGNNRIKFLTLPSVWWKFEKRVVTKLKAIRHKRIRASFVSCERDWKLFCLASIRIPKSNKPVRQKLNTEMNCQVVTNGSFCVLVHSDIMDFISITDKRFDCIWIDATCPINDLEKGLLKIGRVLNDNAVVVITFLKGRERKKLPCDRIDYAKRLLAIHGLESFKVDEYNDSCPMIQMAFKKTA